MCVQLHHRLGGETQHTRRVDLIHGGTALRFDPRSTSMVLVDCMGSI